MFRCEDCDKSFATAVGLNGHKRIHGPSQGKIKKIFCSCIFTRYVIPYQDLAKYQSNLVNCRECNKLFRGEIFCSQSCSATFNNRKYPKRIKQIRPVKVKRVKKVLTIQQKRARNVATVQAYRARKYAATPPDADMKLITLIFEYCPKGYEVDHIVALSVGGPHHQDNLQYLPTLINQKKNKYENYDKSTIIRWQDVVYYAPK